MTQVAIIGSGIVGAEIAYELSLVDGLNLTLFDENEPASGSTGSALGVLMGAISQKTQGRAWEIRHKSLKRYEKLIPELESLTGFPIPFNRQGLLLLLFAGEKWEKWEKLALNRRYQGWKLDIWNRTQLHSRCPQIEGNGIMGGVYSPQDRQVNPTLLTQALVAGARKNGVKCQFGVKVQNIKSKTLKGSNLRRCCSIQTSNGPLAVDWLVIAAGLGSTPLTASLGSPVDIRPVLGQGIEVKLREPLGNPSFQPTITGKDVHIVPVGEAEYWIGATVEFPKEGGEIVPATELLEEMRRKAISFCPALAEGTILRRWWGKRPRPEGQPAPIIGELPGYSNVLLATGHYRNGVLLAPATALAIREKLTNYINYI